MEAFKITITTARVYTTFAEELFNDTHQVAKCQAVISNKTFNLMKFSKMSCIQCFIPKHTIYRKIFSWPKFVLHIKCVKVTYWTDTQLYSPTHVFSPTEAYADKNFQYSVQQLTKFQLT